MQYFSSEYISRGLTPWCQFGMLCQVTSFILYVWRCIQMFNTICIQRCIQYWRPSDGRWVISRPFLELYKCALHCMCQQTEIVSEQRISRRFWPSADPWHRFVRSCDACSKQSHQELPRHENTRQAKGQFWSMYTGELVSHSVTVCIAAYITRQIVSVSETSLTVTDKRSLDCSFRRARTT